MDGRSRTVGRARGLLRLLPALVANVRGQNGLPSLGWAQNHRTLCAGLLGELGMAMNWSPAAIVVLIAFCVCSCCKRTPPAPAAPTTNPAPVAITNNLDKTTAEIEADKELGRIINLAKAFVQKHPSASEYHLNRPCCLHKGPNGYAVSFIMRATNVKPDRFGVIVDQGTGNVSPMPIE